MSDPIPATNLDLNAWYHITEQAVDPNYRNDFKAMLRTNQDKKANDTNLHVWPVKTDNQAVKAYWQFVSRPSQPRTPTNIRGASNQWTQLSADTYSDIHRPAQISNLLFAFRATLLTKIRKLDPASSMQAMMKHNSGMLLSGSQTILTGSSMSIMEPNSISTVFLMGQCL